jgi:hypothetical protein
MNLLLLPLMISVVTSAPANVCGARTAQADRIVTGYATASQYAAARTQHRLPETKPDEIRLLSADSDAETCATVMRVLRGVRGLDAAESARSVVYEANGYYYVVLPPAPSRCRPTPHTLCIDTRWAALFIFDSNFNIVARERV